MKLKTRIINSVLQAPPLSTYFEHAKELQGRWTSSSCRISGATVSPWVMVID